MQKTIVAVLLNAALWASTRCLITEHFLITNPKKWADAQKFCREQYDDLSSVKDDAEMQQLLQLMSSGEEVWIGLYRKPSATAWLWSDGSNSSYQNWGPSEPNEAFTSAACARIKYTQFYDYSCGSSFYFFCSKTKNSMVVVQENMMWEEALVYCRTHYRDLVSLLSDADMTEALQMIGAAQGTHWWTGLRYLGDRWMWVNGDPLGWTSVPLPQCPLQPFQCGALETEEPLQVSRDCEEQLGFICSLQ